MGRAVLTPMNIVAGLIKALLVLSLLLYAAAAVLVPATSLPLRAIVLGAIGLVLLIAVYWMASSIPTNDRVAIVIIVAASALLLFAWNQFYVAEPYSDYEALWDGAHQILDGTFAQRALQKDDYFCFYNFQIGYTSYMALCLRLFGDSLATMKVVEAVVMTVTNVLLFKTLRLFVSTRTSMFATLLFATFPYVFLGAGIMNNQHEGLMLVAASMYVYLRFCRQAPTINWKSFVWPAICGTLLAIGNVLRPTCSIVLIAMVVASALYAIVKRDPKRGIATLVIPLAYLVTFVAADGLLVASNLAPYGIRTSNLWFKLILGLTGNGVTGQSTTDHLHTQLYYDLQHYGFDYELYKTEAKNNLVQKITSGGIDYGWVFQRYITFAGGIDNQVNGGNPETISAHPTLFSTLNALGAWIYMATIVASAYKVFKTKNIAREHWLVVAVAFLGYVLVYCVLEKQTRYRYEQYYLLFVMGALALGDLYLLKRAKAQA